MKKWTLLIALLFSPLFAADWDESIFYAEQVQTAPPPFYPFSLSGSYVNISDASFRVPVPDSSQLHYSQWETAFAYTHPFSPTWGLIFGAGWVGSEVNMQNNPEFDETIFNYVNFSVGAFTKACTDWTWTLTFSAFFDQAVLSLIDYTLYQGIMWGRYTFSPCIELDFGLIVEAGLKKTKVWPILGFVYIPYEWLRLYAVYPVNVSLEYDFAKCLTFAASLRFLRNRHRVEQDEINSQGIFEYRNTGAEFDAILRFCHWLTLKGFAGYAFGGNLRIADRNNENAQNFRFNGSFYAGVSGVFSF